MAPFCSRLSATPCWRGHCQIGSTVAPPKVPRIVTQRRRGRPPPDRVQSLPPLTIAEEDAIAPFKSPAGRHRRDGDAPAVARHRLRRCARARRGSANPATLLFDDGQVAGIDLSALGHEPTPQTS